MCLTVSFFGGMFIQELSWFIFTICNQSPVGLVSKSHSLRAQKQRRSSQSAKSTEADSPAFFATVIPLQGLRVYHFNNVFIGNKSQHTSTPDGLCLVIFS